MKIAERIDVLRAKHAALEAAIDEETNRPLPDATKIHDLKRQKLKIKDEMAQINRH
ncbi:MAG: YdcH family protein [Alphaproteobacteria bacterium]